MLAGPRENPECTIRIANQGILSMTRAKRRVKMKGNPEGGKLHRQAMSGDPTSPLILGEIGSPDIVKHH